MDTETLKKKLNSKEAEPVSEEDLDKITEYLKSTRGDIPPIDVDYEEVENDPDLDPEIREFETNTEGRILPTPIEIDNTPLSISEISKEAYIKNLKEKLILITKSDPSPVKLVIPEIGEDYSDEEIEAFVDAYIDYSVNKNSNIFANLPERLQNIIRRAKISYPKISSNDMAISILKAAYGSFNLTEATAIDIEASIKATLGLTDDDKDDFHLSCMKERIEVGLQKIADQYREDNPEYSATLDSIIKAYKDSYTLEPMYKCYDTNSSARKAVRKYDNTYKKLLNEFNYKNEKSLYRMQDCSLLFTALIKLSDLGYGLDEEGVTKFIVLFFKTCENLDPTDLIQSTYMYYSMKNICLLSDPEEAKTPFAGELINNIKDLISYIRKKEDLVNGSNKPK